MKWDSALSLSFFVLPIHSLSLVSPPSLYHKGMLLLQWSFNEYWVSISFYPLPYPLSVILKMVCQLSMLDDYCIPLWDSSIDCDSLPSQSDFFSSQQLDMVCHHRKMWMEEREARISIEMGEKPTSEYRNLFYRSCDRIRSVPLFHNFHYHSRPHWMFSSWGSKEEEWRMFLTEKQASYLKAIEKCTRENCVRAGVKRPVRSTVVIDWSSLKYPSTVIISLGESVDFRSERLLVRQFEEKWEWWAEKRGRLSSKLWIYWRTRR